MVDRLSQFDSILHMPGQAAAIRFFDPESASDLQAMREILRGKQVKKWMDHTHMLSQSEYRDWAGTETKTSFLFAVLDAAASQSAVAQAVRGFIYIYSEREEKFRVRRMEKHGFLPAATGTRFALEVSFAARPLSEGMEPRQGLMSSALRQACLQVEMMLNSLDQPEIALFGFVDPENTAAQRTVEACGFVYQGAMRYDWDSWDESSLYMLDRRVLQQKLTLKMLEVAQARKMREV
jgi:hypothetical protein